MTPNTTCEVCGASFQLQIALLIHKLNIHKILERNAKISDFINAYQLEDTLYSSDSDCEYRLVVNIARLPKIKSGKCVPAQRDEDKFSVEYDNETEIDIKRIENSLVFNDGNNSSSSLTPSTNNTHNTVDTERKAAQCEFCNKQFYGHCNLHVHLKTNHYENNSGPQQLNKPKSYQCYICKKVYSRCTALRSHFELKHPMIAIPEIRKGYKTVQCHLCEKLFARRYTLGVHLRTQHYKNDYIPKILNRHKSYQCYICKKFYVRHSTLKFHLATIHTSNKNERVFLHRTLLKHQRQKNSNSRIETGKYFCNHCDTMFHRRSELEQHWIVLKGEKPFFCKKCFTGFDARADIIQHKRETSTCRDEPKIKKQLCPYCGKYFERSNSLNIHIRTHTNEKPFLCNICNRSFAVVATLRQHMNSHTKHKSFVCSVQGCEKTFSYLSGLRQHRYNVHEPPRFKCTICDKMFAKRGHMK